MQGPQLRFLVSILFWGNSKFVLYLNVKDRLFFFTKLIVHVAEGNYALVDPTSN